MAREIQESSFGGNTYQMTLLPATRSYKLFHRLFKMFGPSFGQIIDVVNQEGGIEDLDLSSSVVSRGILSITENVKESDLDHVIQILKEETHVAVDGGDKFVPLKGVFEAIFQGDVGGMFQWLYWGLGVQYESFFGVFNNIASQKGVVGGQEKEMHQ